jgi:hypothetical protein
MVLGQYAEHGSAELSHPLWELGNDFSCTFSYIKRKLS